MAETLETKTVVVSTGSGIPHGTMLETPAGMPNVVVKAVSPIRRIATRVLRVYVNSLVGMLTIVGLDVAPGVLTPPADFLDKLGVAAGFALAPAGFQLLTNLAEKLAQLDS